MYRAVRATALCSLCALALVALPRAVSGEPRTPRSFEIAGGVSVTGNTFRSRELSGAGPYVALELRLAEGLSVELDYRRHTLSDLREVQADAGDLRAESRMVSVMLRHSLFTLRGERYVDVHAGLGSQRFELEGAQPCSRRNLRLGVTMLQPGRVYHVSNRVEIRFGIDMLLARAWPTPGPVGCTGPCTSATSGRSHDIGFLGTLAIGIR